jgi:uncharacterized protein DUF5694
MSLRAFAPLLTILIANPPQSSPPLAWPPCREDQTQIVLLGVFHMADDGALVDVTTPRRQAELDELARQIAAFKPSKIAVERPLTSAETLNAAYREYFDGAALTNRNEAWQIGFRIARMLNHPRVYPVDFRMNLGTPSLSEFYKQHPDALARVTEANKRAQARDAAEADTVRARSISDLLLWMADRAHLENSVFFSEILPLGAGDNYAGAEMLARWYERNLRITQNLLRIKEAHDKRIVLIIGNGHVSPLKHLLETSGTFCPVSARAVLSR